jgi:hypothetical protein
MSDKIVFKNTTDSEATLVSRAEGASAGSPDEIQPGELIVQREVDRTTLYSVDNAGSVVELPGRPIDPAAELGDLLDTSVDAGAGFFFQDFDTGTPVNYTLTSNTYIDTTSNLVIGTGTARSSGSGSTPMNFDDGAILDQTKRYDFYSFLYAQSNGPIYRNGNGRYFPHWGGVGNSYSSGGGYLWSYDFYALTVGGPEIYWCNGTEKIGVGNYQTHPLSGYLWNSMHFLFDWGDNPAPNGTRENPPNTVKVWFSGSRIVNSTFTSNTSVQDAWIPIDEMRFKFLTGRKGNAGDRLMDEFHLGQSNVNPWPNIAYGLSWNGAIEAAYGSGNALVTGSTLKKISGLWSPGTVASEIALKDLDDVNISSSFVDPDFDKVTFLLNPYATSGGFLVDAIQGLTPTSSSADNSSLPYLPIENSSVVSGGSSGSTTALFNANTTEAQAFELAGVDWTVEYYTLDISTLEFNRQNSTGTSFNATVFRSNNGIYLRFQVYDTVLGWQYYTTPTYADNTVNRSAGVWSHVAFSKSGSTLRGFWNGTLIGTLAFTEPNWQTGCNRFEIRGPSFSQGVRITKGVARYTANFTPPTSMQISSAEVLTVGQTIASDGNQWSNATAVSGGTFGSG